MSEIRTGTSFGEMHGASANLDGVHQDIMGAGHAGMTLRNGGGPARTAMPEGGGGSLVEPKKKPAMSESQKSQATELSVNPELAQAYKGRLADNGVDTSALANSGEGYSAPTVGNIASQAWEAGKKAVKNGVNDVSNVAHKVSNAMSFTSTNPEAPLDYSHETRVLQGFEAMEAAHANEVAQQKRFDKGGK